MKKILLVMLCLGLAGCATTMSDIITPNRESLLKLSVGMTKEEAINIMPKGKGTVIPFAGPYTGLIGRGMTINNPYRSEILQGKDKAFEVIYYVTDVKKNDDAVTDDELTPLVFDNGKLIGWGWGFLQDNAQKYEIRIR